MNNVLKYFYYAGICCLLISCKKSESDLTTITVVEFGTNKPVPNAIVDLYKVNDCSGWFSCTYYKTGEVVTNENGVVAFTNEVSRIGIRASGYFEVRESYPYRNIQLDAVGKVKMHCINAGNYPDGSKVSISFYGNNNGDWYKPVFSPAQYNYYFLEFVVNKDSTFVTDAVGGQMNTIDWSVHDNVGTVIGGGGPLQILIPRTGVAELELKY